VEALEPTGVAAPAASYVLGTRVLNPQVLIHTAGIVGASPDGTVSDDLAEQAKQIWSTIAAVLAEGGLALTDIVSYTAYVVDGQDLSTVMAARDEALRGHRSASTLIVVPRLARPEWRMEISAIAAR
jgi:enamine deaminase RidA (YjgF/YER057c/UK114 family)